MKTNLHVPFAEKDEAKRLGARWNAAGKVWYVENKADLSPFARWLPRQDAMAASGTPTPAKQQHTVASVIRASNFVAPARICDCLPWDVCDACRSTALDNGVAPHANRS